MKRFANLFTKPDNERRPWVLWTWNLELSRADVERQLNGLVSQGVGGVAIQAGRNMRPAFLSEDFFELLEMVLEHAAQNDVQVRLSFDLAYPWTTGMDEQMWRNKAFRANRLVLEQTEEVPAKSKYSKDFDDPDTVIVVAARFEDGRVASLSDIRQLSITKGTVSWTAPSGDWRVLTFRRVEDTDAFGTTIPNVYSSDCAAAFSEEVLGVVRKRLSKYMTGAFKGIVLETPVILPREGSIPWDDDLVVKYRSRYKKDLIKLLPVVFCEVAETLAKSRPHLYHYLLQSMYERFVAPVETWIRKHHLSQWVLCAERGAVVADGALRNHFAIPETSLTACGLQSYDGVEEGFTAVRAMTSMNDIAFRRETVVVVGRSLQRVSNSHQMLKNEIDAAYAAGASHILIDGFYANVDQRSMGKAGFSPFWYSPDWDSLSTLFSYATALGTSLADLQSAPQIAVLYPTNSVYADYRPGHDEPVRRASSLLRRCVRYLREQSIEFDVVTEEFVLGCSIRQAREFGTSDRVRKGNYSVLIIPYARLISKSLLVFVEKLTAKKGTAIFLDEAPEGDFDDGSTRAFSARFEKMLELRKGSIHVTPARELSSVLGDFGAEVTAQVNGAQCPDIQLATRSGDGFEAYLIRNVSDSQDYFANISIPARKHASIVQCARGELHEHPNVECTDDKAELSLAFSPRQSHLVVMTDVKPSATKATKEQKRRFDITTCGNRNYRMVLKNQWFFCPVSPNALPLASWTMRIGLSRESGGYSHFYETGFSVRELPQRCMLVLSGIPSHVGEAGGLAKSLEVTVNGNRKTLATGYGEDDDLCAMYKDMLVCDLQGCINRGPNRVIVRSTGLLSHPLSIVYPPLIIGDFSVKKDARGWIVDEPEQEIGHDSWTVHGFPHLSGVGEYRHVFEVPSKYEGLVLRFSSISGSAKVTLNNVDVGSVSWQ
ncbi:MAG: hypothetical protein GF331_05765, partial [Chitinivibrionales bacterium]|nr:hypothetical protein [Chitinivibrionales bacterium]